MLMSDIFVPQHGDRSDVPNVAIIISDGVPNIAQSQLNATVIEAQSKPINCLAVGVGSLINTKVLQLISSPPHEVRSFFIFLYDPKVTGRHSQAAPLYSVYTKVDAVLLEYIRAMLLC